LEEISRLSGVEISEIGEVEAGTGVHLLDENGIAIAVPRSGFTHF
jgi:hypothetical protein